MTDTNPDPVKALLEACEPLSALVADYEAAGIDTDDVILCGRTSWNAQPDEPEPPRILFRDLRALSRAASVLRERGEPSAHQRCIDELVRGFNTAIGTLEASGNAFSAQNGRMNRDAALSLLNAADDGPHEAILSGPIGEDQSDLVKRLLLIASVIDTELPAVKSDALREAAAHISRTSGSAGRETGWLIEYRSDAGPPKWYTLKPDRLGGGFTTNSTEALRFSRKEDAEDFARWYSDKSSPHVSITEHVWINS